MRIGMFLSYAGGFAETVTDLADYERAGLDIVFVPEAYSFDAVSQLGFIAAKTERVQIASGIFQLYSRTPALTAMTAAGLDYVSGGRFTLGLGASGPQVIEGWHGVPYDAPIARASIGPKNVALAAELAESWMPIFYLPEKAGQVWGGSVAEGAARRDPSLGPLDVIAHAALAIGDDVTA